MKISLVIPLCNEQESLAPLVEAIGAALDPKGWSYEIIFIDDGSSDGSFEVIRKLKAASGAKIRAYRFSRNYGKAAGLSVGIAEAQGEIIITMDADLQDDPAELSNLADAVTMVM